jgi:hypothetical protein
MRAFAIACATLAMLALSSPGYAQTKFATELQAQQHCPNDVVVWLNLPTGIYHMKGERWYGRTKNGAYVCEREADQAGDRETHNEQ